MKRKLLPSQGSSDGISAGSNLMHLHKEMQRIRIEDVYLSISQLQITRLMDVIK